MKKQTTAPAAPPVWQEAQAREEYISGSMSYRTLAGKWGVTTALVKKTGGEQQWYRQRLEYQARLRDEPGELLYAAVLRLCRCAENVARDLDHAGAGKNDVKTLHDAAVLCKDLMGLIQSVRDRKEEKTEGVTLKMEGDIHGYSA